MSHVLKRKIIWKLHIMVQKLLFFSFKFLFQFQKVCFKQVSRKPENRFQNSTKNRLQVFHRECAKIPKIARKCTRDTKKTLKSIVHQQCAKISTI